MPQQDSDKETKQLLAEIKAGVPSNFTSVHAKLDELIDFREINNDDTGVPQEGKGGIRPRRTPIV